MTPEDKKGLLEKFENEIATGSIFDEQGNDIATQFYEFIRDIETLIAKRVEEAKEEGRLEVATKVNQLRPDLYITEKDLHSSQVNHIVGSFNDRVRDIAYYVLGIIRPHRNKTEHSDEPLTSEKSK